MSPGFRKTSSWPTPARRRPRSARRAVLLGVLVFASGCSFSNSKHWLARPKTSAQWLDQALEAKEADDRRRGVVGLSESRDGRSDWAMKVYDTIARTDRDAMVRCAALQAMTPSAGAREVPTAVGLLSQERSKEIRPAPAAVRWEAAKLLLDIVRHGTYDVSGRKSIQDAFVERTRADKDRNVRLTAIDALGYFPEKAVADTLVDVLDSEEDFALVHAAELSLILLTGQTHDHSAKAWRAWFAETKEPFATAGAYPQAPELNRSRWQWPY